MTKEVTFNQAAKDIFKANQENIKTALNSVVNNKALLSSAAQIVALTTYQAIEANGSTIPAANIGAYLGLSDDETKKLKQYVSRASFVHGYKGKSYESDGQTVTTPHDDFMTDNAPSITTTYKAIKAHEKTVKAALEQAAQAKAMELKAAQAYVDSGADMPSGVTNADELLAVARGDMIAGRETDYTTALALGVDIVEQANIEAVNDAACADLLGEADAILQKLVDMNSESANDVLATIYERIEAIAASDAQEAAKQAA